MIDRLALIEDVGRDSSSSQECKVAGCFKTTRDKPWCSDHIHTDSPYALRIIADLEKRELEVKEVTRRSSVKRGGFLVSEATRWLHEQPFTVGGLSRIMHVQSKVAEAVLKHVVRHGVGKRCSIRGKYAVSLIVKTLGRTYSGDD